MKTYDLTFSIAGKYLHTYFADKIDGRELLNSYAPFYVKMAEGPIMTDMRIGSGLVNTEPEGEEVGQFDCGGCNHGVWLLPNGGYKMIISDVSGNIACAFRSNADFSYNEATIFGDIYTQAYGVNNAIMIAFAFSGARQNLLLMHSSVTMNGGKGYLFLGKSGTGKSTHSDLWVKHIPGSEILNDDNPAIRLLDDGSVRVYGTPWSGKRNYYRQLSVPVGAYVQLEQAPVNEIHRLEKLQGFATILSSTSTMIWDKPTYDAICDTVSAVAMHVPVFHLKNRPEEAAARMSFEAVTSAQ